MNKQYIIYYPPGRIQLGYRTMSCRLYAEDVLDALEHKQSIAFPSDPGWDICVMEDGKIRSIKNEVTKVNTQTNQTNQF